MRTFTLKHTRSDGTFVIALRTGAHGVVDYHVVADDPLFPAVAAAAQGVELEPEPRPEPPPPDRRIAVLAFIDRLSPQRQAAIAAAALTDGALLLWLLRLVAAQHVDLDAAETMAGVALLRAAALLTAEESAVLLA